MVFIDNTTALACLVKGYARQPDAVSIVGAVWRWLLDHVAEAYFEYVPSKCNIADGPSRGSWQLMAALRAQRVETDWSMCVRWFT